MDLEGYTVTLEGFDECEPGYWLGQCYIFGTMFHVEAVRVNPETGDAWFDSEVCVSLVDYANEIDPDVRLKSVKIPDLEGEYLVYIFPSGR